MLAIIIIVGIGCCVMVLMVDGVLIVVIVHEDRGVGGISDIHSSCICCHTFGDYYYVVYYYIYLLFWRLKFVMPFFFSGNFEIFLINSSTGYIS